MNTSSKEHLAQRHSRYDINAAKDYFYNDLKGLTVIELAITELCTRKCGFCPRADSDNYPNQKLFMSQETITNLANSCKEHNYQGDIHISGFGESYTNKEFLTLVRTLRGILPENRIVVTTNGDLLNVDTIRKTYSAGINYMIVSCYDGKESMDNFASLYSTSGISDSEYEIRKLWLDPGETVEEMMKRNKFNNRSGAVVVEEMKSDFCKNKCYLPFYKLVIDWNGDALLCCNDWYRKHKGFGNINDMSLKDIWYGDDFRKVRGDLNEGKRKGPACSNCNINGIFVGEKSVEVLSQHKYS